MSLHVLGCAGSLALGHHTTTFRIDADILLDAGSGLAHLPLAELACIDHVLLTHSHIDHLLGVPLLVDGVLRLRTAAGRPPITVHALPETLDALSRHILNDVIWPDFTRLPRPEAPALTLRPLAVGDLLTLGARQRRVRVLPAAHSVPAVGYAIHPQQAGGGVAFSGDTGPCPALWAALRAEPVATLIIEAAFADHDAQLAARSGHHTPESLARELAAQPGPRPFGALRLTHAKPGEEAAIAADLSRALAAHGLVDLNVAPLCEGERIAISPHPTKHVTLP